MGASPKTSMGVNLRLAMSGIGQAVSPLMGLWIFAQIRQCLDRAFDLPASEPLVVYQAYVHEVIADCKA